MKSKLSPKLRFPEFQNNWEYKKIAEILDEKKRPIDLDDEQEYSLVTVKRNYGGIVSRGIYKGKTILVKSQYTIHKGDFLISKRQIVHNACGVVPVEFDGSVVSNEYSVLIVKKGFNINFINYFTQQLIVSKSFKDSSSGIVIEKMLFKLNDWLKKDFLVSSFPEQQKIADCLTSLDSVIDLHTQKLDELMEYKRGLMQNLFPQDGEKVPKLRFPEFQNAPEWEGISLIEVVDKKVRWSFIGGPFGSNLQSSDYTNNGIRIIQLQNIGDGIFHDDYKIYTSIEKADELLSCNIYSGDIILSKMGDPVARACIIPGEKERFVMCSDGIRFVVNEENFSKYFIFSLINSQRFRCIADKAATGSTRKRIGLDVLKKLDIMVSTLPEQQKIADLLSLVDEQINEQKEKIEQLKEHKNGLMQQLFPNSGDL